MKPLLRKIFFCDAPVQGKFLGLTLLVILPRLLMTIGYAFALPAFLLGKPQNPLNFFSWVCLAVQIVIAVLCALILLGRPLPRQRFDKPIAIALGICAFAMLGFWWLAPRYFERLWWVCPIVFFAFALVYQWYPTIKIRDWLMAVVPLLLGGTALYCTDIVNIQAFLMTLPCQNLSASADYPAWLMWGLTVGGVVLLALAYLLFARIVAMIGNVPFRSLFGRGVGILWLLFIASYVTSASMALSAMRDYRSSRKELDGFWKMPVSVQAIEELYRKSGCVDQKFWKGLIDCKVEFPALDSLFGG
ncbi:MAG: hypothetical protein IJJ33_06245, partial [Victivallales bacterium]|nr:hypothetical protein [Victivallales bacterium]